jgi:dTDP-4-amino-4,6-dideoxygalactose transaminase
MQGKVDNLALFSGVPAFPKPLHVGTPNIGDKAKVLARIEDILERRHLTNHGPFVQELEQRIADIVGVKHCIAMSNATVALEIVARALGLSGEVIMPSMTFVATAHALQWQQVTPVFCDIDPHTHQIDPARVESMITPRTSGILGVHLWGQPCDVNALAAIAKKHGLKLMFDAAHAFGCSYGDQMIGSFGDAEVFSFHATKFINAFEGGAVVTNNDTLAEQLTLMRNFGFSGRDEVTYIGINGKMNEAEAAMGLTSLESIDNFIAANYRNYCAYRQGFEAIKGVRLRDYEEQKKANYQYIIVEMDSDLVGLSRDEVALLLTAENIDVRRYFYPGCHRMEPYRSYFPHASLLLPHTERVLDRVLAFPTGTAVGPLQIKRITRIFQNIVENSTEIKSRLDGQTHPLRAAQ